MAGNWIIQKRPVAPETVEFMLSITDRFVDGNWLQFGFKWHNSDKMRPVMVRNNYFPRDLEKEIFKNSNRNTHSYVCPHAFSYGKRTGESLFALQNIVIDVDCHSTKISKQMRDIKLNVFGNLLENDAFSDYDLPLPNYLVFTGRGIQIWWKHEPMSARACKDTWVSIVRCFIEIIKRIIADHSGPDMDDLENLEGLEVDEAASLNTVGFFRIPGTFNPKAREYSYLQECLGSETVYSYQELRRFRDEYRAERPIVPKRPAGWKPFKIPGREYSASAWAESTAGKIEKLRDLRDEDIGNETRNNFCMVLYCLYRAADLTEEAALERLHSFNDGFKKPMSEQELKSTLSSAIHKDYKYSTFALIRLLDISKEEAEKVGLKYCTEPKEDTKSKEKETKERNKKIIHLYITTDKTQQEVADEMGLSRKVVGTVLRENGISRADRNAKKIQKLNEKGKSVKQISKNVGCSNRTVYRALKNTAGEIAGGAPEAAQTNPVNQEMPADVVDNSISAAVAASKSETVNTAGTETSGKETPVEASALTNRESVQPAVEKLVCSAGRFCTVVPRAFASSTAASVCDKMFRGPPNNGYP